MSRSVHPESADSCCCVNEHDGDVFPFSMNPFDVIKIPTGAFVFTESESVHLQAKAHA